MCVCVCARVCVSRSLRARALSLCVCVRVWYVPVCGGVLTHACLCVCVYVVCVRSLSLPCTWCVFVSVFVRVFSDRIQLKLRTELCVVNC